MPQSNDTITPTISNNDSLNNIEFYSGASYGRIVINAPFSLCEVRFKGTIINAPSWSTGVIECNGYGAYPDSSFHLDFSEIVSAPYQTSIFFGVGLLFSVNVSLNFNNSVPIYNWRLMSPGGPLNISLEDLGNWTIELASSSDISYCSQSNEWPTDVNYCTNCYQPTNCNGITSIKDYSISKKLLKITDILGREVNEKRNTPLFYIYNDGTVEKKMIIK